MNRLYPMLGIALLVAACSSEPTSPRTQLDPNGRAPSIDRSVSASDVVIDDFMTGGGNWQACGNDVFVYFQDPSIIGGARELRLRDGGSCHFGPFYAKISIDAVNGTASWHGNNTYAPEQGFEYGTAIGTIDHSWSRSPNKNKGVPLHLALSLDDDIMVKMVSVANGWMSIGLRDAAGNVYATNYHMVAGTNLVPLSSFPGLTAAAASDIDGIFVAGGMRDPGDVFALLAIHHSDATPPEITPTITGTFGQHGWYTSDVSVAWTVKDPESAVTSTSGCETANLTTDTDANGASFTCTATSTGGTAHQTATVMRDATAPTVSYSGNAGTYTVDQTVAITCAAADAQPGSGLASSTCANVSGDAYTFNIGANSYSATAMDNAGNQGSGATSFNVVVTFDGVCALTERWVSNGGIANALCAKLRAAAASAARGDMTAESGQLGAYRNQLAAQTGKGVAADKAAILSNLVGAL